MSGNRPAPPGAVLGGILVVIGLAILITRYVEPFSGAAFWPWFIIGPGLVLFVIGLILPNVGMIIGGSVVTTVGVLLAWQSATGLWATWAYAWALVGPTASGVGTTIGGLRIGNGKMVSAGLGQILIGLALFVGGYLFFEQVLDLTGNRLPLPEWVFPAFLIGLGVLVIVRGFFAPRDHYGWGSDWGKWGRGTWEGGQWHSHADEPAPSAPPEPPASSEPPPAG